MAECSVVRALRIERAGREAWERLCRYHYRHERLGPCSSIYSLRSPGGEYAGVIVYTMPAPCIELRDAAIGGLFRDASGGRGEQLGLVNENVRCIARVVIEPRYRGLGLAGKLVAATMPLQAVAMVEALAVMGEVNSFFERAGMVAWRGKESARCVRMQEALSAAGVEAAMLLDAAAVHRRLEGAGEREKAFIDEEMERFLQAYGKRRWMPWSAQRTRFVLSRLTGRPVYYLWRDENKMRQLERRLGRR